MNKDEGGVYFSGKVEAIFFSNAANLYKVLLLEIDESDADDYEDSEIVVTGTIGDVIEGDSYVFHGHLISHPKYGEQLAVETYEKAAPTTGDGLVKYLSSSKFPGIGKETAKKIVKLYPTNTVDAILETPGRLNKILSSTKKKAFLQHLSENHGMESVLSRLYAFGLTGRVAAQIFTHYKERSLDQLKENPYQLVEDIEGIGFARADAIAAEQGIADNSPERIRAGLMHVVREFPAHTGDTYIERENLLGQAAYLLAETRQTEISAESLPTELDELIRGGRLRAVGTKIFERALYQAEEALASNLTRLLARENVEVFESSKVEKILTALEKDLDISYDDRQRSAILAALASPIFILTGGPGTGKTTIINGFLEVYARLHGLSLDEADYKDELFPIVLAAPTGRASRRLSDLTGLAASTLHRALGITTDDEDADLANDLSGSLLIVDEFSMVDTWLANKLFAAIPPKMKVLLVGDADQLASVGPGQILSDLLNFQAIPSVKLDRIYRQSENSTITELAHAIKNGNLPADFTEKRADRNYFPASSHQIAELIEQIADSWQRRGNDPFALQVLIPMYKGPAGINAINQRLQQIFNPIGSQEQEFALLEQKFRAGDKVLQLVNNAEHNVFNGDIGKIIELIPAKYSDSKQDELLIDFEGQELNYARADWGNVRLAYAMSIHKSQGSEFETVVLPLVNSYSRMLQRNLLYTAVTRAKHSLILLGEVEAFNQAVNKEGSNRQTFLLQQLRRFSGNVEPVVSNESTDVAENVENAAVVEIPGEATPPSADFAATDHLLDNPFLTRLHIDDETIDPLIGLTEADFAIFTNVQQ